MLLALMGLSSCVVSPQAVVTRVTAEHDRERLWAANVAFVVRLQARLRGFLVRRELAARRSILREQRPAAVRIQVMEPGSVPPLRKGVQAMGGCLQHPLEGHRIIEWFGWGRTLELIQFRPFH